MRRRSRGNERWRARTLGREVGAIEVRAQVVARGAGLAPDAVGQREVDEPLAAGMRRRWRIDEVLWHGAHLYSNGDVVLNLHDTE